MNAGLQRWPDSLCPVEDMPKGCIFVSFVRGRSVTAFEFLVPGTNFSIHPNFKVLLSFQAG